MSTKIFNFIIYCFEEDYEELVKIEAKDIREAIDKLTYLIETSYRDKLYYNIRIVACGD